MKKIIYSLAAILALSAAFMFIYNNFFFLEITASFDDLEPVSGNIKVYYKGFEIGKAGRIKLNKDYTGTQLKLRIKPKDVNLPENIAAELHTAGGKPYVKIIYPDTPSEARLKEGSIITGRYQRDINSFINEAVNGESMEDIMICAAELMKNTNTAVISLTGLLDEITGILKEVHADIKDSAENFKKTSSSLNSTAEALSIAIDKDTASKSFKNAEAVSENLKNITSDINSITEKIDKISIPSLNALLAETERTAANTDEITSEINNAVKKRTGIMRLLIGRPQN